LATVVLHAGNITVINYSFFSETPTFFKWKAFQPKLTSVEE